MALGHEYAGFSSVAGSSLFDYELLFPGNLGHWQGGGQWDPCVAANQDSGWMSLPPGRMEELAENMAWMGVDGGDNSVPAQSLQAPTESFDQQNSHEEGQVNGAAPNQQYLEAFDLEAFGQPSAQGRELCGPESSVSETGSNSTIRGRRLVQI